MSSCDGRDKAFRTAKQDLFENKTLDTFNESITYIPKTYFEEITDTIFNNGYQVSVKFYSDMDNAIVVHDEKNNEIHKNYFRDVIIDIDIKKHNKEIFKDTIDKSFLIKQEIFSRKEAAEYVIRDYWLENIESDDGFPIIILDFINPSTKNDRLFKFNFLEKEVKFEEVS